MARQAYHITSGDADLDCIKVAPDAWYNIGSVQSLQLDQFEPRNGPVWVNTLEQKASAVKLVVPDEAALETDGRPLYVFGGEGHRFITDDGA